MILIVPNSISPQQEVCGLQSQGQMRISPEQSQGQKARPRLIHPDSTFKTSEQLPLGEVPATHHDQWNTWYGPSLSPSCRRVPSLSVQCRHVQTSHFLDTIQPSSQSIRLRCQDMEFAKERAVSVEYCHRTLS